MTETFTYGLFNRPAMYGTVPAGFTNEQSHKDFAYGTIDYSHRLTDEEIYRYELARVSPNTFDLPIGATVERMDAGESGYTITRYYRGRYILTHKATGDEEYSVKVSDVRAIAVPIAVKPVKAPAMLCPECGSTCKSLKTYADSTWGITHTYKCMSCGLKFDQSFPDATPEAVDAHGNAVCERCHRNPIFYADSERFCQPCLLAIESEYDAKIAREELQSLYNSDSGVDAEDYRAHIDAFAPEAASEADEATPAHRASSSTAKRLNGTSVDVKYIGHGFFRTTDDAGFSDIYITDFQLQGDLIDTVIVAPKDAEVNALRAKNEALKQQLATARANLAVAQKALIAITSVKYDDMQAVRDRAETGLIESDYYVASLK